jgi:hypothetical protein
LSSFAFSQPKTNLDVIYDLIENNINKVMAKLPNEVEPFTFEFSSPEELSSLQGRYINRLSNMNLLKEENSLNGVLKYSLDQIGILYSEPFRESLLGDYKVERKIFLNANFAFGYGDKVKRSEIVESVYSDTLYYSDIEKVEIPNLSITQGTKPAEPLFESLLEPVIAVGAVIVTIILLFTVRSK